MIDAFCPSEFVTAICHGFDKPRSFPWETNLFPQNHSKQKTRLTSSRVFIYKNDTFDQADMLFRRADRRDTLREAVFL